MSAILEKTVRVLALLGSLGVVALMLHVCADVLLRALLGTPIPATVEIASRYYMVLISFLPLAWVQQRDGMVSIGVLDNVLPPAALRWSDVTVSLVVATAYGLLAWITFKTALKSYAVGIFVIVLNEPFIVWPSYFLPPLGFALAAIVCLARAREQAFALPASGAE